MTVGQTEEKVKRIVSELEATRDGLLDFGKEIVSLDEGEWPKVQKLFELAQQTDLVRTSLKRLFENSSQRGQTMADWASEDPPAQMDKAELRTKGKKRKADYPKFSIRGDTLVKTGLGRDLKSEYEHLVSRGAFDTVLRRLDVFRKVDEFVADEVQEELDLPSYQTYIVLAVLKDLEILDSPRRGVYSLRGREATPLSVDAIWNQLAG